MKRIVAQIILLPLLISCESTVATVEEYHLSANSVTTVDSFSVSNLIYADDERLLASSGYSPTCLISIPVRESKLEVEESEYFLTRGRALAEIQSYANYEVYKDTVHILSYSAYGIDKIIRIPFEGINDIPSWTIELTPYFKGLYPQSHFGILDNGDYVLSGGERDSEKLICFLHNNEHNFEMYDYVPDDGFDSNPIVKHYVYRPNSKLFVNGDDILYVCGEGRLALIINSKDSGISYLYDEFPKYSAAPDGMNFVRDSKSWLGMKASASEKVIFMSPYTYRYVNGNPVPDNYKGYPPYYMDRIEAFSWKGEKLYTLSLEYPFDDLLVDESGKRLYTIAEDLVTGDDIIYQYDLPADID